MEKHYLLFFVCLLVHVSNIMTDTEANLQCETNINNFMADAEAVPQCGANETYLEDPKLPPCEKTCANPQLVCVRTYVGWKGCRCLPDHVRDKSGNCVLLQDCPTAVGDCGLNEYLSEDGTSCAYCEATCRAETGACNRMCHRGCYCNHEHVRNEKGICIPLSECLKS